MFTDGVWRGAIDHELPAVLSVERGTALVLSGWLHHREAAIDRMWVEAGTATVEVLQHSVPRVDVYRASGGSDGPATAFASGFWCVVPVPPVPERVTVPVVVRAVTRTGQSIESAVAHVTLVPHVRYVSPSIRAAPADTVICMTTHNPRIDLLERQIESIRAQSDRSWRCIISDDSSDPGVFARIAEAVRVDPRFELHQTRTRLGFYFNFEAALQRVPPETAYIALADQDDEWAPDKLAALRAALEEQGAVLAYSDQRVVTPDGRVLSSTFWATRANYCTGLRRMLAGNTVTGAASLFRRGLLTDLLPFPPKLPSSYHDHWLAVVALARGRIAYVDRPLSDYVQHAGQVLGHDAGFETRPEPAHPLRALGPRALIRQAEDAYFNRVLLQRLFATVLLLRFRDRLWSRERRALRRVSQAENTLGGVLELVWRAVTERPRETLGYHRQSALGAAWALRWRLPYRSRPTADVRRGVHPAPELVRHPGTRSRLDS